MWVKCKYVWNKDDGKCCEVVIIGYVEDSPEFVENAHKFLAARSRAKFNIFRVVSKFQWFLDKLSEREIM